MDTPISLKKRQQIVPAIRQRSTLANLQKSATRALAHCTDTMRTVLDQSGVDPFCLLQLTLTADGAVVVEAGQGDERQIESALNHHRPLVSKLYEIEVLYRMLHSLTGSPNAEMEAFHLGLTSLGPVVFFTRAYN